MKQYIYRQRCLGLEISVKGVILSIKQIQRIEKFIAVKNNRLVKHLAKWRNKQEAEELGEFTERYISELNITR